MDSNLKTTLTKFKKAYDERVENGGVVPLIAKEIATISPESGDTQETPFILQGTGTANGTSSVDTGTVGKHIQKQGSVYCVNQLVNNGNFANTNNWGNINGNISASLNVLSYTITEISDSYAGNRIEQSYTATVNHKYLVKVKVKCPYDTTIRVYCGGFVVLGTALANTWTEFATIITPANTNSNNYLYFDVLNQSSYQVGDVIQVKEYQKVDLTQWFNGNIPQDLLDHPEHWGWYQNYGNYITYNTGELVYSNGRYLVCGGRNLFDGTHDIQAIPSETYYCYGTSITLTYKDNNGNTISSETKTNETFTTPSNCAYIGVSGSGNICISLYYSGEDYSQYYPYEQPKVYDTGDEQLFSTGVKLSASGEREDIYDYKEPDGTILHRLGRVKLKDLTFQKYESGANWLFYATVSGGRIAVGQGNKVGVVCSRYVCLGTARGGYDTAYGNDKLANWDANNSQFLVKDTSYSDATAFMNSFNDNDYLIFELATPTTEEGTPFSENIEINDFGTMGWYATYTDANTNALASVPQGCKIFYPAWYVGFIDTLGQRADIDWNANNVVSASELSASETDRDKVDNQIIANLGGMLRHMISGVDFNNTDVVDLGNLSSISYDTTTLSVPVFVVSVPNRKGGSANMICPLYKNVGDRNNIDDNMQMSPWNLTASQNVIFRNSAYTNVDDFKAAMKGVLLAYEKAS